MTTLNMFSQAEPKPNSSFPNPKMKLSSSTEDAERVSLTFSQEEDLLRRLDWRILPIVTLLWLLAFLDRSNIGMKIARHVYGLRYAGRSRFISDFDLRARHERIFRWGLHISNTCFFNTTALCERVSIVDRSRLGYARIEESVKNKIIPRLEPQNHYANHYTL
jgi:hypothetical protein